MKLTSLTTLLENRFAYATLLLLFTLAIGVSFVSGGSVPAFGTNPALAPDANEIQNADANQARQAEISPIPRPGPSADAARGSLGIGPIPAPSPWDDVVEQRLAIGPIPAPSPWDDVVEQRLAIGPIPAPSPWDDVSIRSAVRA